MIKRIYITFYLLCLCTLLKSQDYNWARSLSSFSTEVGVKVVADNSGNSYSIGYFNDTVDFDPSSSVSNLISSLTLNGDSYIRKLDSLGHLVWAKKLGGSGYLYIESIDIDKKKNLYIAGMFCGAIDFDPSPTTASIITQPCGHGYILKLDSLGNFKWVNEFGANGSFIRVNSVSANTSGYVYFGGYFDTSNGQPIYFGSWPSYIATFTTTTGPNGFVCKLDTAGNIIWAKQHTGMIGTAGSAVFSVVTNTLGDVYMTGNFKGVTDFDPGVSTYTLPYYPTNGNDDIFISKLDINGSFLWAKAIDRMVPATYWNSGRDIILDNFENVYTVGCFRDIVDFDPGPATYTLASGGVHDGYILKLDLSGNFIWVKTLNGPAYDDCKSIAFDNSGNLIATGPFSSGCDLNPGPGTNVQNSAGLCDSYVLSLDQNGNYNWVKQIQCLSTNGYCEANSIIGNGNKIYVTGTYAQSVDFNPGSGVASFNSNSNSEDAFILQLGPCNFPFDALSSSTICVGQCATLTANGASNYTWSTSSNSTSIVVCPSTTSTYTIAGDISSTCTQSNSIVVTLSPCTGINENELAENLIIVYPNPFKDKIKIESIIDIQNINISNLLGQSVLKINTLSNSNEIEIDMTSFPKGIYFVSIQSRGHQTKTFKIIKE
jgi:Secretion system C-terminal sorting domain